MAGPGAITVVFPTYRREKVLLESIAYVMLQDPAPGEILLLDQTEAHEPATQAQLEAWNAAGAIRWMRLPEPSIPKAMNQGLLLARHDLVLFLDDDIRPEPGLLKVHLDAHARGDAGVVAGRVIQPWHEGQPPGPDEPFHFATTRPRWIGEFMGGNFSIRRQLAIALGGFDENFVRVAYRFEAEFSHRLVRAGHRIRYEPDACIHHLKAGAGGTRAFGNQFTTWHPDHAVGAYYHALRTHAWRELLRRPFSGFATRYHLRHPWRIPGSALAELGGLMWAVALCLRGPSYIAAAPRKEGTP
jgi:GT2 family glycosyltransferase